MSIKSNSDCSEGLILSFYVDDARSKMAKQQKPRANNLLIKELTAITKRHQKLKGYDPAYTALRMANKVLCAYDGWIVNWNGEWAKHLQLSIDLLADYKIEYKKLTLAAKLENK